MLLMLSVPMLRSQSSEEHLKFKGIPITGSKENFVKELKKQGFVEKSDGSFKGKFALANNAIIKLESTPTSNIIYRVIVYHPLESHSAINGTTNGYERLLTQKYNIKSKKYGGGYQFKLDQGEINISIDYEEERDKWSVVLTYTDYQGNELRGEEQSILSEKWWEQLLQDV